MIRKTPKYFVSFFLGVFVFYIFLCFHGLIAANLIDSGLSANVYKYLFSIAESKEYRKIVFLGLEYTQQLTVLFILIWLFSYFYATTMNQNTTLHSFIFALGALSSDQIIMRTTTDISTFYFTDSFIFINNILNLLLNIFIWTIFMYLAIKLSILLINKTHNNAFHHRFTAFRWTRWSSPVNLKVRHFQNGKKQSSHLLRTKRSRAVPIPSSLLLSLVLSPLP